MASALTSASTACCCQLQHQQQTHASTCYHATIQLQLKLLSDPTSSTCFQRPAASRIHAARVAGRLRRRQYNCAAELGTCNADCTKGTCPSRKMARYTVQPGLVLDYMHLPISPWSTTDTLSQYAINHTCGYDSHQHSTQAALPATGRPPW